MSLYIERAMMKGLKEFTDGILSVTVSVFKVYVPIFFEFTRKGAL